jgi:hypothetical protein
MAGKYADRMFLAVNGAPIADVQSASIKRNRNARPVKTMTRNGRNKGIVEGNHEFELSFTLAVKNDEPYPKLDFIDFTANSVALVAQYGIESLTYKRPLRHRRLEPIPPALAKRSRRASTSARFDCTDATGNPASFEGVIEVP